MPNRSLETADIASAPALHPSVMVGARPHPTVRKFERFERRHLRNMNYNHDIPGGSSATSKKSGLNTKRCVNPLTAAKVRTSEHCCLHCCPTTGS